MSKYQVFKIALILMVNLKNWQVLSQTSKIDSNLAARLEKGEKLNILVSFGNGVRSIMDSVSSQRHADRGVRNTAIVSALKENVNREQQDLVQMLSTRSSTGGFRYYRQYWTSNKMFVREADLNTVKLIADNPLVSSIKVEPRMGLVPLSKPSTTNARSDLVPRDGWHIPKINLTQAWDELDGNQGEGVIVGIIDSGVKGSHECLAGNFRGAYGWFDGVNGTSSPHDPDGHGTACLSVAVGLKGSENIDNETVGVAPGAKWMACLGCGGEEEGNECSAEHLLNCIQFMSCPTLPDGSNPDCSKAPHVLSFSIGGERSGEPYDDDFATLKDLGIIPVAAAGNSGPRCETTNTPANLASVIAVGGTLEFEGIDELVGGSSRGPSPNGTIKPDLVAPGAYITGAGTYSNNTYSQRSGTSLSTPQVAGVIALLHVRNPNLTFEEAYKFVTETTVKNIAVGGGEGYCKEDITKIPNNLMGYGMLNALNAVKAQTAAMAVGKA